MPYVGKTALTTFTETVKDSFNGDNSSVACTMSQSVGLDTDIEVFVGNVQQEPGSGKAYTVSGTTLTFSEAPPTGTANIYVIHRNSLQGTLLPPQNLGDKNYLIGGNLSLDADSAALNFGADSEITVTHVADTGLNIKHTATGDDKPVVLTLQTGETDIAQDVMEKELNDFLWAHTPLQFQNINCPYSYLAHLHNIYHLFYHHFLFDYANEVC